MKLLVLAGDDEYHRRKKLRQLIVALEKDGWKTVEIFVGEDPGSAAVEVQHRMGSGILFTEKKFLIVHCERQGWNLKNVTKSEKRGWQKLEEVLWGFYEDPKDEVSILIHIPKNPVSKKGDKALVDVLKKLPDKFQMVFKLPKFYKIPEAAAELCVREAEERGKTLPLKLAQILVEVSGTDFGFLSNEVLKVCQMADSMGDKTITKKHLAGSLTQLDEVSMDPFIEAVGLAYPKKVARYLKWIENTHSGDPTMKVSLFLASSVTKWLVAANLYESGISPDEAAGDMDQHPYYFKKKILPPAKRWGEENLSLLLQDLARAERSILQGAISPWLFLQTKLLESCERVRS